MYIVALHNKPGDRPPKVIVTYTELRLVLKN